MSLFCIAIVLRRCSGSRRRRREESPWQDQIRACDQDQRLCPLETKESCCSQEEDHDLEEGQDAKEERNTCRETGGGGMIFFRDALSIETVRLGVEDGKVMRWLLSRQTSHSSSP